MSDVAHLASARAGLDAVRSARNERALSPEGVAYAEAIEHTLEHLLLAVSEQSRERLGVWAFEGDPGVTDYVVIPVPTSHARNIAAHLDTGEGIAPGVLRDLANRIRTALEFAERDVDEPDEGSDQAMFARQDREANEAWERARSERPVEPVDVVEVEVVSVHSGTVSVRSGGHLRTGIAAGDVIRVPTEYARRRP